MQSSSNRAIQEHDFFYDRDLVIQDNIKFDKFKKIDKIGASVRAPRLYTRNIQSQIDN